ncbi:hypothetical protein G4G27_03445 [Sphingomonas sp. So64.6b]|uniref:M61 family metallopeptidase n=1 Tax=Sphingomonas sp. So64.6b TaxID=2997354 RepID=UPI0016023101|nr:hypothetical protein [Sphingomonas sp. So64.6b]QNA83167.1 hypothetical protein G4G27_03445 [Sphingomonas sp. So64.6b]
MTAIATARFGAAMVLTLAPIGGDSAATGQPAGAPLIDILITPDKISEADNRGAVAIQLTVPDLDVAAGGQLLSLGTAVPGAGRPQPVADLAASDAKGPIPLTNAGEGEWTTARAVTGRVVVRYRLPLENVAPVSGGPPINLRIDGDGFSVQGMGLVMTTPLKDDHRIAIRWNLAAMGQGAEGVTSYGDGDVELPAGTIGRIADTVFMAGHVQRVTHGAFSAVWTGTPPFDPRPAMDWTAKLHRWMSGYFGDVAEPPYRVFLRQNPMNAGGGAAFPHSFLVTWGNGVTGDSLRSILGHEMTHTWTANAIGNWYNEGNAVFYQSLLAWRAGLIGPDEYLNDLNQTASRYFTNPMKNTPEAEVQPRFWEDTRIRVLPYDRGAMYFAVLNGEIRRASAGKRSVDDLIKVMVKRDRAGEPITEAVWLDLLRAELGEQGPAITRAMLDGGLMLPRSEDFGPCFRRTVKQIRMFDLGFDPKSIVSSDKIVAGLKPESEAYKAGLRDGDRIRYGVSMDSVQGDVTRTLDFQVTRGGKTFPLTYLPRGRAVAAYQWERVPGVSAAECKL